MDEKSYIEGSRQAWRTILQESIINLGYDSAEKNASAWILEREAAIAQLRRLCELIGDNGWPENLHLADIIEKHVIRHVE